MATKSISKDFTQGNIARQLFFFAIPFMASNALQVLYSTIYMIIVGPHSTSFTQCYTPTKKQQNVDL